MVYGESGSGKTSLIQCGLRSEVPPEDALFITIHSAIDPVSALGKELTSLIGLAEGDLKAQLRDAAEAKGKTLVLDQFEELFLFQPPSVRNAFIKELSSWVHGELNLRVIIGIREEYLARLTELEEKLPELYHNRLWVRRMGREQAQEVITAPCQACGVAIEKQLTEALLEDLTHGGQGIELPILQVVLDTSCAGSSTTASLGRMPTTISSSCAMMPWPTPSSSG